MSLGSKSGPGEFQGGFQPKQPDKKKNQAMNIWSLDFEAADGENSRAWHFQSTTSAKLAERAMLSA